MIIILIMIKALMIIKIMITIFTIKIFIFIIIIIIVIIIIITISITIIYLFDFWIFRQFLLQTHAHLSHVWTEDPGNAPEWRSMLHMSTRLYRGLLRTRYSQSRTVWLKQRAQLPPPPPSLRPQPPSFLAIQNLQGSLTHSLLNIYCDIHPEYK